MSTPAELLGRLAADRWVGWRPVPARVGRATPALVTAATRLDETRVELDVALAGARPRATCHRGVFTCLQSGGAGAVLGMFKANDHHERQIWVEPVTRDWLSAHIGDFVARVDEEPYREFQVVGAAHWRPTPLDYLDWHFGVTRAEVMYGGAARVWDELTPPPKVQRHRLDIRLDALETFIFLRGVTPRTFDDRLAAYEEAGAVIVRRSRSPYEVFRIAFHLDGDSAHLDEAIVPTGTPYGDSDLSSVKRVLVNLLLRREPTSREQAA